MSNPESADKLPETVSLNDEEGVKRILMETVFGMWDIVNNLVPPGGNATGSPSSVRPVSSRITGCMPRSGVLLPHWPRWAAISSLAVDLDSCRLPMKVRVR